MDRRNFLTVGPARRRTRTATLSATGGSQNPPAYASRTSAGLEPYTGVWDYPHAAHLLRRAMIGPTEKEIRQAVTDGLDATVAKLLTPFTPSTDRIKDWVGQDAQYRPASASQADLDAYNQLLNTHRNQLNSWWLNTFVTSPVSIQERMTLFWHNHFTSDQQTVQVSEFLQTQNQLLRTNALGNFKQFAKDVTKDVAMLIYLDGIKNYKSGSRNNINENYARELQELFTMGVVDWNGNPNYTQDDVSNAARALSGYTVSPSSKGANYLGLTSQFVAARWDSGQKTFLGKTGNWNADDIVDIIISERGEQVAKYICEKIYRAFVYDVPDRVVIAAMASTFQGGNWEIKPVMQELLKSAHFFDTTNIGDLDKGPVDYMVGMIRALGLQNVPDFVGTGRQGQDLANRLMSLGQMVFMPPNVKGWPGGRTWISTSTLPPRQKFAIDVANAAIKQQNIVVYGFDPIAFAKQFPVPGDIHALSDDMTQFLLNTPPSARESAILYDTLLDGGKDYEWAIDDPEQKPDVRIRKFLVVLFQLAKFQLY